MKTTLRFLTALVALAAIPACRDLLPPQPEGTLLVSLEGPVPSATRAGGALPDPGSFLLSITDASGSVLYEGRFDHAPDELSVPAGTYTVSAASATFSAPAFEAPLWGDTQVVSVTAGGTVTARLECSQLNSGLTLDIKDSFRQTFPNGTLRLKSAEGSLEYGYAETRTAFFLPGAVSLTLDDGGFVQTLFTRTLEKRQMLTVRVSAEVGAQSGGVTLQLDTARTYLDEQYLYGSGGADSPADAYGVAEARTRAGEKGVWVQGYIVGVATGTGKVSFTPPFSKNTNLVLGTRVSTDDTGHCLTVELRSGPVREALNLMDHPGLLGHRVYIKGDLVSAYYGIPGLKAPSEYQLAD